MNEPLATTALALPPSLGFGHFIAHSDAVGKALLILLVLMSVASWALLLGKGLAMLRRRQHSRRFLARFWQAGSLAQVHEEIRTQGVREPFARLTAQALQAQGHHARVGGGRLAEAGTAEAFLTRTLRKVLDEEATRMENGLSLLATVGATAPFVGLFGTVWGVYQALVAIGMSGAGTLDKVAGPVGEALIMTGVGLAVAIPAVMGYNALVRSNRVLAARLDAFAFELHTLLSTGASLQAGAPSAAAPQPSPAAQPARVSVLTPATA